MRRSCGRLRVVWIVPVSGPYPARISPYQPVSARIRMRAVGKRWARETLQWRRTQLPGRAITVDNKQFSSLPLSRTAGRCPGAARARVPASGARAPGDRRQLEKRGTNMTAVHRDVQTAGEKQRSEERRGGKEGGRT